MGRLLGWWDFAVVKKNHLIWKIAKSTKNVAGSL